MMNFENLKSVYFLGIGGIGMSALARYFNALGKKIYGYDKTSTPLTDELISEGMSIHFEDDVQRLVSLGLAKEDTLIVLTPAIPKNHAELNHLKQDGYNILKRSQVLGLITQHHYTVAVAGTHGKTTTSSMIAHLLKSGGIGCIAFLGGISKNYNTNLLLPEGDLSEAIVVVEADEYDRSFLTLHPDLAVITSMDADHLDIYGDKSYMEESYRMFARQANEKGLLILRNGLQIGETPAKQQHYALSGKTDFSGSGITIAGHRYRFSWHSASKTINGLTTQLPGSHNVENAVAAIAVADSLGLAADKIIQGMGSYEGVRRRFDYQIKTGSQVYIDDYAHHPEELRACISSVKELYPESSITGIFQPHLYSRTRDFAEGFGKALSMLDDLILLDIYPARELPIEGVTSQLIFDQVHIPNKALCTKEDVLRELKKRKVEVLLTLGAGDIDQLVEPIRNLLLHRAGNSTS